jgi:hypothetical protein
MKLERTVLCAIGATLMACGGAGDDADGVERDLANYDLTVPVTLADLEEDPDVADYYASAEVTADADLTIEAGVVIAFDEGASLRISSGALRVRGRDGARVVFREREAGKGWLGVAIYSPESQALSHLTIEDAGNAAFWNNGAAAALTFGLDTNTTSGSLEQLDIVDSKGAGLVAGGTTRMTETAGLTVTGSAGDALVLESFAQMGQLDARVELSGNGLDGARVTDINVLDSSVTVTASGVPFTIENTLSLAEDNTLRLEAGVSLAFATDEYLSAVGLLQIEGTPEAPVTLTAADGAAGGWAGLWIRSAEAHVIRHAVVRKGGGDTFDFVDVPANIVVGDGINARGKLTLEDSTVSDSEGWGVYTQLVDEGDFVTADVTYSDNALGDVGAPSE